MTELTLNNFAIFELRQVARTGIFRLWGGRKASSMQQKWTAPPTPPPRPRPPPPPPTFSITTTPIKIWILPILTLTPSLILILNQNSILSSPNNPKPGVHEALRLQWPLQPPAIALPLSVTILKAETKEKRRRKELSLEKDIVGPSPAVCLPASDNMVTSLFLLGLTWMMYLPLLPVKLVGLWKLMVLLTDNPHLLMSIIPIIWWVAYISTFYASN